MGIAVAEILTGLLFVGIALFAMTTPKMIRENKKINDELEK
jgi:hypothetical protein